LKIIPLSELPIEGVSHQSEITKKVMIRDGELPHVTGFAQAYLAPGRVATAHSHAGKYEVFLVESGEGTLRIGDRTYRLTPQICVIVEPPEMHEIASTGTTDLVLTYFGLEA